MLGKYMELVIGLDTVRMIKDKKIVRKKGESQLFFPNEYTLIDLETTGYDPRWDHIIEIGAIKVRNENIVDKLSYLVSYPNDNFVPFDVESMTGITEKMIENQGEKINVAIQKLLDFVGSDLIVGFNVNFDINFIYDTSKKYFNKRFQNNYVDVLRMARRFYPKERHNRLKDCIKRIGLNKKQTHRGLQDCYDTKYVLDYFKKNSNNDFLESLRRRRQSKLDLTTLKPESDEIDKTNPFYDCNVCFTGKLDMFVRRQAAQIVTNMGGVAQNGITMKTNYLILGDTAYSLHNKGTVTTKLKKARELISKGQDLKIINESLFVDMICEELDGKGILYD
ncbi:DNA polymerase III [Companilactobacillus mindensis DSM 14500]|uniref:DNA polymerase III polC-type n=2 Tax=Companilactobacillus mindensis TaxID=167481 RepID=A0A0R1QRZ3_9LACO|nr:DNA polymerase III [Companilactobacillus mindensis DSM 14500]